MNFKISLFSLVSVCSISIVPIGNEEMTGRLFELVKACEQHLASTQATERLLFDINNCLEQKMLAK